MLVRLVFLITFSLTFEVNANGSYSLLDDATAALERLKSIMTSAINSGRIRIDSYYNRLESESNDILIEAEVIMGYEKQKLFGQIEAIEELAQSSGADLSNCLGNYEELLTNLTTLATDEITECVTESLHEASEIVDRYKYLMDIKIHRVYLLENQLRLCDPDSESCITPLYERIQLEIRYGRDLVDTDSINANSLINRLRTSVRECSNLNISSFASNVDAILQKIADCADAGIKF